MMKAIIISKEGTFEPYCLDGRVVSFQEIGELFVIAAIGEFRHNGEVYTTTYSSKTINIILVSDTSYSTGTYVYAIDSEWLPTGEHNISGDIYVTDKQAISFLEKERNCIMDGYVGIPQNGDNNRYYIKPLFIKF